MEIRIPIFLLLQTICGVLPVAVEDLGDYPEGFDPSYCSLPRHLGYDGTLAYLEDCATLDQFTDLPIPAPEYYGVQPKICCPKLIKDQKTNGSVFEYGEELDYDYDTELLGIFQEKLSDAELNCQNIEETVCTSVSRCDIFNVEDLTSLSEKSPVCSFDQVLHQVMVCCPKDKIRSAPEPSPEPRFPVNGAARECEDRSDMCETWAKNDACALNKTFELSDETDDRWPMSSGEMFKFTSRVCLKSCQHCGIKGCVDELPMCKEWARQGMCVKDVGNFMAHTCRESCGVCGYLSPFSTEEQRTEDGKSYSNIKAKDFDCGRYKSVEELNKIIKDLKMVEHIKRLKSEVAQIIKNNQAQATEALESFLGDLRISEATQILKNKSDPVSKELQSIMESFQISEEIQSLQNDSEGSPPSNNRVVRQTVDFSKITCGATIVSDRFIIADANCYGQQFSGQGVMAQTIRTSFPSLQETIEVRHVYLHPNSESGDQYGEVALLELGRRIQFNFDLLGDTPACLDTGIQLEGKEATIQGFGLTEHGTRGRLTEGQTTFINNDDCVEEINQYFSTQDDNETDEQQELKEEQKKELCTKFPHGLTDQHICGRGKLFFHNGSEYRVGPCKGDTGGSVQIKDDEGKQILTGIIGSFVPCLFKAPVPYTRTFAYRDWVTCIMAQNSAGNFNKAKVEEICKKKVQSKKNKPFPICSNIQ